MGIPLRSHPSSVPGPALGWRLPTRQREGSEPAPAQGERGLEPVRALQMCPHSLWMLEHLTPHRGIPAPESSRPRHSTAFPRSLKVMVESGRSPGVKVTGPTFVLMGHRFILCARTADALNLSLSALTCQMRGGAEGSAEAPNTHTLVLLFGATS